MERPPRGRTSKEQTGISEGMAKEWLDGKRSRRSVVFYLNIQLPRTARPTPTLRTYPLYQ